MGTNPTVRDAGASVDEVAHQEFLRMTHTHLNEYARFADTKAAFAGAVASALLGGLYTAKAHIPIVTTAYHQWPTATWLAVCAGFLLCASVALGVWTVLPRLRGTPESGTPEKGFIFWKDIADHGSFTELQESFHSHTARQLNDRLLKHVWVLSKHVLIPKYRAVLGCIWALALGAFLAICALMLQDAGKR
jgi:hypothetical protein